MRTNYTLASALVAAFGLGALATEALHAQAKPPAYAVLEADISDRDAYMKDFAPKATKALEAYNVKFLARGGQTVPQRGAPPTGRVVISMFESLDQAKAAFASPAYQEALAIGEKAAKIRSYLVEGLAK